MLYCVLSAINVKVKVSSWIFGLVDSILPIYLKIDQCTLTWTAYPVLHLPGGAHCTLRCPQRLRSCGWFEAIQRNQTARLGRCASPYVTFWMDDAVLNYLVYLYLDNIWLIQPRFYMWWLWLEDASCGFNQETRRKYDIWSITKPMWRKILPLCKGISTCTTVQGAYEVASSKPKRTLYTWI